MSKRSMVYLDSKKITQERVEDLLSQMTTEEKVGQMLQLDAREGVDKHIGEKHAGSILHTSPELVKQAHKAVQKTRLQIPILVAEDCIHGHSFWEGATIFPTQLGMAASWNPQLLEKAARITAIEAAATGIHWTFSPVLCVTRDLRWGRVNETFGEDIHLIGELASAMVSGYQGGGLTDPTAILATAKHFAGYSETQGGRDASEADLSQRKLRSWFLPPFEKVAGQGCGTFMLGYQSIDGVPITINDWLLDSVLRGEWGYEGILVTDWDNVGRMVWEQRVQPDIMHAAAAAINAGNDVIMTTPSFYEGALEALDSGLVSIEQIDEAVRRILTLKFELGLFEDPRPPKSVAEMNKIIATESSKDINLEIARQSIVLLQNNGVLPLSAGVAKKIAIVGPNAIDGQTQLGDWAGSSGQVDWLPNGHPEEMITTIVQGIEQEVPESWQVVYERGANILTLVPHPDGEVAPDGQPRAKIVVPAAVDQKMLDQAVTAANESDYVIAVVGDRIETVGEMRSTATLELLGGQKAMLDALAETGKPFVVVILASKPVALPESARQADAILWAANPGMEGGRAIAEIIVGKTEPTGRLPITFPQHVGQQPVYYNQIRGQHGDRYADLDQEPLFSFGHGLSYTQVNYQRVELDQEKYRVDETARIKVTLENVGDRPTIETVQVYVSDLVTSVSWAAKELKSFAKVALAPGQRQEVEIDLPISACSIVNAASQRVVESGQFEVLVGRSSRNQDLIACGFEVIDA